VLAGRLQIAPAALQRLVMGDRRGPGEGGERVSGFEGRTQEQLRAPDDRRPLDVGALVTGVDRGPRVADGIDEAGSRCAQLGRGATEECMAALVVARDGKPL
jgi:hypothetical protein